MLGTLALGLGVCQLTTNAIILGLMDESKKEPLTTFPESKFRAINFMQVLAIIMALSIALIISQLMVSFGKVGRNERGDNAAALPKQDREDEQAKQREAIARRIQEDDDYVERRLR